MVNCGGGAGLTTAPDDFTSPNGSALTLGSSMIPRPHGPYVAVGRADEGFPVGDHAPGSDADGHHVLLGAAADGVVSDHLPNELHQSVVRAPSEDPGSWNSIHSPGGTRPNTHPPTALKASPHKNSFCDLGGLFFN